MRPERERLHRTSYAFTLSLFVERQCVEVASETLDSTSAVAHRILLLTTQLGESLLASLRTEDGVIAETMVTGALERDLAIDCALEEVRPVFVDESDDSTEAGTTWGRYPLETLQKESYILFEVACSPAKRAE